MHVQQPKEREQQDLPPNDHPKPAPLDVIHSEILESIKIDGKEDWDAFKLKFNRLSAAHHWTTLEKRDNIRFCLTGVISELYFLMLKKKWAFHEIMQGLEVSFGLPEVAQLLEQERCADTKTVVAPCLAGTSVHAGNPVGSMSPTTNIVYAGRLEQTHDLSGAKLIPLSLKRSSELTLHNSSQGLVNSQNEFESKTAILTTSESSEKTDQRETGREVDDSLCFASGSVTKSVLAVEVNNASKSDSNMYDRTVTITGRELVNTMCFASDSVTKSDPPVEVNNASETQSDRLDGATRVAWGATNKDLPWRGLVVAFLDASSGLRIPSGLPRENKCWSVPWLRSRL